MKNLHLIVRLKDAVGGYTLGSPFYKFLRVHTLYLIFTSLPGVFINTFLMSQSDDVNIVLYFNCLMYASMALTMLFSSGISRKLSSNTVAAIGIIGFNLLYLALILLNNRAAEYFYVLGILNGVAGGFYWMSYSNLLTASTTNGNRDSAIAIISISGAVVTLLVPLISGFCISMIPGDWGYISVFGLALAIAIATCLTMTTLPKCEIKRTSSQIGRAAKMVFTQKYWMCGMLGETMKGLREGAFAFILTVILYEIVSSEMLIGFNTFLSGVASIVIFVVMSRIMRPQNRVKYMALAIVVLTLAGILLVFFTNPFTVILLTVLNALFSGFIVNSANCVFYAVVQARPEGNECAPELFAVRECFFAVGRCAGILLIVLINMWSGGSRVWQTISLVILTLTQFGTMWLNHKSMKMINEGSK